MEIRAPVHLWNSLPILLRLLVLLLLLNRIASATRLYAAYVVVPHRLYRESVMKTDVLSRVVDPEQGDVVAPDLLAFVRDTERTLFTLGFSEPLHTTSSTSRDVSILGSSLDHAEHGDYASIVSLRNETVPRLPALVSSVTFVSRFEDAAEVVTSNDRSPRLWPYQSHSSVMRFTDLDDVLELYRLHRRRVDAYQRRSPHVPYFRGRTLAQRIEHERSEARDFYDHLVSCGYRRRGAEGLRMTRRGAAFTAWRRLFPWRELRAWNERRLAAAVRQLG
jgi:hypothetical protein